MSKLCFILVATLVLANANWFNALAQCEGIIAGTVTYQGAPCIGCTVTALLEPSGSLVWPVADEAETAEDGSYTVTVPENSVIILLVKANPDVYMDAVPTFSGSVVRWGQAVSFTNACADVFTANVAIVVHQPRNGSTVLSGRVLLSSGKMQAEDPISLVDIVIERTAGPPIGATVTNIDGEFFFEDVEPDGSTTYTVRVNLPCVPNPGTYVLSVGAEDMTISGLDFCIDADTTLIANCLLTGISTSPEALIVRKFAHVASDQLTGNTTVHLEGEKAWLTVYSMSGTRLLSSISVESGQTIPLNDFSTGLYIAEITSDSGMQHVRFRKY